MGLAGKRIVVGVGGGIAAFKTVEVVRELMRRGAAVRVVMTRAGARFVGPVTFAGITGEAVVVDLWDPARAGEVHVELGGWADALVVAPATANLLARAASGMADDALLATLVCARGPVLFAPAMHTRMWRHAATARNLARLDQDGAVFVGPVEGALADGTEGEGRMAEPADIVAALEALVGAIDDLRDRRLVVTSGPTYEDLDPVRFLGNRSSGRMGHALARRAVARGARVTLVTGPVALPHPDGADVIEVRSAVEMHAAVTRLATDADAVIMAAAVADYRPRERSREKLKKTDGPMTLELVRNPDILAELGARRAGDRPVLVGFALETQDAVAQARDKLRQKRCDLMVANEAETALATEDNRAVLVTAAGEEALGVLDKRDLADRVLDRVRDLLAG